MASGERIGRNPCTLASVRPDGAAPLAHAERRARTRRVLRPARRKDALENDRRRRRGSADAGSASPRPRRRSSARPRTSRPRGRGRRRRARGAVSGRRRSRDAPARHGPARQERAPPGAPAPIPSQTTRGLPLDGNRPEWSISMSNAVTPLAAASTAAGHVSQPLVGRRSEEGERHVHQLRFHAA